MRNTLFFIYNILITQEGAVVVKLPPFTYKIIYTPASFPFIRPVKNAPDYMVRNHSCHIRKDKQEFSNSL